MRRTTTEPLDTEYRVARWWHADGDNVVCDLCPHVCVMADGEVGLCLARANIGKRAVSLNYGKVCASQADSIEKKPVFHFEPGAKLYSVGSFGCNLDCDFCQNYQLARPDHSVPCADISPELLVKQAEDKGVDGIAFTYNEPTIWSEYILDVSRSAHEAGLFVLLNTNGFVHGQAREDLLRAVDVIKVDIKGFSEDIYRDVNGGSLGPVLDTCMEAKRLGVHLELSYLMVPGVTDRSSDIRALAGWIIDSLGDETPLHLFRFQPEHRMRNLPPEDLDVIKKSHQLLKDAGLLDVYVGGLSEEQERDTKCSVCGELLIRRGISKGEPVLLEKSELSRFCPSYSDVRIFMKKQRCPRCGGLPNVKYWHG